MAKAALTISGKLQDLHPAKLYYSLFKAKKFGILIIESAGPKLSVFIQEGLPVCLPQLMENDPDILGTLAKRGTVTRENLQQYLAWGQTKNLTGAKALIRRDIISRQDWEQLCHDRYRQRIFDSFGWRQGNYSFADDGFEPIDFTPSYGKFARLIIDGVRQHYNALKIRQQFLPRLKTPLSLYKKTLFSVEEIDLEPIEQQLFVAAGAGATIQELFSQRDISVDDTAKIIFALLVLELFKFERSPSTGKAKTAQRTRRTEPKIKAASSIEELFTKAVKSVEKYEIIQPKSKAAAYASTGSADRRNEEKAKRPPAEASNGQVSDQEIARQVLGEAPKIAKPELDIVQPLDLEVNDQPLSLVNDEQEPTLSETSRPRTPPETSAQPESDRPFIDPKQEGSAFVTDAYVDADDAANADRLDFSQTDSGEMLYRVGLSYLDDDDFHHARQAFLEAVQRGHDYPEVQCHLGWAIFKDREEETAVEQALAPIKQVMEMNKDFFLPYLMLGRIARDQQDYGMAEQYFTKTQQLNQDCLEAREELRKLLMRW